MEILAESSGFVKDDIEGANYGTFCTYRLAEAAPCTCVSADKHHHPIDQFQSVMLADSDTEPAAVAFLRVNLWIKHLFTSDNIVHLYMR